MVGDDNTVAGSGLSCQCPVLAVDFHFRLQDDFARNGKYDGQRLVFVLLKGPAQRPFATVVEIGYRYHLTAAAS